MAETLTPPKKEKKSIFGAERKPDQIIFRLLQPNQKLRDDTPMYPPLKMFPNTDIITWNFGTTDKPDWSERAIRYLPGYATIFVDEQEKDGRVIAKDILDRAPKFEIIDGDIRVRPTEKTKLQFLDICNRNIDSPNRTGRVEILFGRYTEAKKIEQLAGMQEKQQEALEKAFKASDEQIAYHAKYLGIPMIDGPTSATRTAKAIITDYRQVAIDNPELFLKTYDDEDLKFKFLIEKAIEGNVISLTLIPGKAIWVGSKEEICEITEGTTAVESLFNFSKLKAGEGLVKRLTDDK